MNINYIEEPQTLIDAAFSRGRKASSNYPKQKTFFYTLKGKELAKIDASAAYLMETLEKAVKDFPSIEKLDPFYRDLIECIIDTNETRKQLASISSVVRLIKKIRTISMVQLKELKYVAGKEKQVPDIAKRYFGRTASLIKGLKEHITYYNEVAKKLKELPKVKADEESYILAGFPNAGKSTLLAKLTTSKPEIAAYPFTTKGLNVGHFKRKYLEIQVIDTPGLLDRALHERNKIELKAITALQYLKGTILFVVDPFEELEKQKKLLEEIRKLFSEKGLIVIINKTDAANEEQTNAAKEEFRNYSIIIEGNGLDNLKEELTK